MQDSCGHGWEGLLRLQLWAQGADALPGLILTMDRGVEWRPGVSLGQRWHFQEDSGHVMPEPQNRKHHAS